MPQKLKLLSLFIILTTISVACSSVQPAPTFTTQAGYPVDPLFEKFYRFLGGQPILGYPISPAYEEAGVTYQFTTAALMVYDPGAMPSRRFRLAPLGLLMDVTEPPVDKPEDPNAVFLDGHLIHPVFLPLFRELGGESVVGSPLTEARYNEDRQRFEQFFENVGFYLAQTGEQATVDLLAYGAWSCGQECRSSPPQNSIIDRPKNLLQPDLPSTEAVEEITPSPPREIPPTTAPERQECCTVSLPLILNGIAKDINQLQDVTERLGIDFTGFALTGTYTAQDGQLEQIFENVVVFIDPNQPGRIGLRTLPGLLSISQEAFEQPSDDPVMNFYPVQGEQGFNVPAYFQHYIELHGGFEKSGAPITRFALLDDQVYWQCFENLCLEEHRSTPDGLVIRPSALGYAYKEQQDQSIDTDQTSPEEGRELSLQVWEFSPRVASIQEQEIEIAVYENQRPLIGVQPIMTLTYPDGTKQIFPFPATGQGGRSKIRIPAIEASNGTLIPYQICVPTYNGDSFCVIDQYLIWNSP